MSLGTPPTIIVPFGRDAGASFITTPIPVNPTGDPGRASYVQGFDPLNYQDLLAGGLPVDGRDFTGLFYGITFNIARVTAGQPYAYDATVATSIAGYGLGAVLGMDDGAGLWACISNNNSVDPDNAVGVPAGWAPLFTYGHLTKAVNPGGVVTLTLAEAKFDVIVLTGALTQNLQVVFPLLLRDWRIVNQTTGNFTTTVKTAAGTGVVVPQGSFTSPLGVYGNGTDLFPQVAPLMLPLSVAPSPNTIVQRDGNAYTYSVYFNQSSGLESPTVGAVFVQNSGADGFFRKIAFSTFQGQMALSQIGGNVTPAQVPFAAVSQYAAALFSSAALTGVPTAPTAAPGTNNGQIATTAFVQQSALKFCGVVATQAGGLTQSLNGGTVVRTGVGLYTVNVAAAGFTQLPIPVANILVAGLNPDTIYPRAISTTTILVDIRNDNNPITGTDRPFQLICIGV